MRLTLARDSTVMHISSPCAEADPEALASMRRLRGGLCCYDAELAFRKLLKRSSYSDKPDDLVQQCACGLGHAKSASD